MGYKKVKFNIPKEIKAFLFLIRELGFNMKKTQQLIAREALICNKKAVLTPSELISGEVEISLFEPETKGLKPIFIAKNFAIFDKPSSVLVHPTTINATYSLLDEVKFHLGKDANITHRIDLETSGVVIASKNLKSEIKIKTLFEQKKIKKRYLALVRGKLSKSLLIDSKIAINSDLSKSKEKVFISENGKSAKTKIEPIEYFPSLDATLIRAYPKTGRTHQIRIHLHSINHTILGDPLYGQSFEFSSKYLDKVLSKKERLETIKANRLMLHSDLVEFRLNEINYRIESKSGLKSEIDSLLKLKLN